jgi:hypothetical protein
LRSILSTPRHSKFRARFSVDSRHACGRFERRQFSAISGHPGKLLIRQLSVNWQHAGDASDQIVRTFARYLKADAYPPLLSELPHFSRGLLKPVGHGHFSVHRGEAPPMSEAVRAAIADIEIDGRRDRAQGRHLVG